MIIPVSLADKESRAAAGFLAIEEPHMVRVETLQNEFTEASKSAQKQIADTQKKIGDVALQAQEEFLKTIEEMGREVMSCATAQAELGLKFQKT